MKRFFRIPLLVIGYYLYIQAGLGAFFAIGQPENIVAIWVISFGIATIGYGLIKTARRWQPTVTVYSRELIENQPTIQLDAPETRPLPKP